MHLLCRFSQTPGDVYSSRWNRGVAMAVCLLALSMMCALGQGKKPSPPRPPAPDPVRLLAFLAEKAVTESSGLAVSRRNPGVLWTHNDSGDTARLFATDRAGRALGIYEVPGAVNVDWEDMATGPGDGENATLYIGDIGDNNSVRNDTAVYRIFEPAVDIHRTGVHEHTMRAERFPYVYPDGKHDAEVLLVHPKTGEIYIISKTDTGQSGVYQFPQPLTRDRTVTLKRIATLTFTNPLRFRGRNVGKLATGGAFSADGLYVAVRTYTDAFEWRVLPGQPLEKTFAQPPRQIAVPWIGQFESLCYTPDGRALLTTSEGSPCPLWEVKIR